MEGELIPSSGATVLDLSTSLRFYHAHIPGAWWAVRSRLAESKAKVGECNSFVLTSEDGMLAHLTAPEAAGAVAGCANPRAGRRKRGVESGRPTETGVERATTTRDDVWYKPYDHASDYKKHARDYLDWEVALVEQVKSDPTIRSAPSARWSST